MKVLYIFITIFVLMFALNSCGISLGEPIETELPDNDLGDYHFSYAEAKAWVGTSVFISPTWDPLLDSPGDVSYSITENTPQLPVGLSLDQATGVITGTPTTIAESKTYTITAAATEAGGYAGKATGTINISVLYSRNLGEYVLSYSTEAISAAVGTPVSLSPKWEPVLVLPSDVVYSIENSNGTPADLPAGLNFVTETGVIEGSPTEEVAKRDYKITAAAKELGAYIGKITFDISITAVATNDISGYTFAYNDGKVIQGVTNNSINIAPSWTPTLPSPDNVRYEITEGENPLPSGLQLNTETGGITGIPTTAAAKQTYSITARGSGSYTGTKSVSVTITIFAENDIGGPDYDLTYANLTTTPVGTPVTIVATWAPELPTSAVVSYSVTPTLPDGLSFTATGDITGTPATVAAAQGYTVTATASGSHTGTLATTPFSITISPIDISANTLEYSNIAGVISTDISDVAPTWGTTPVFPDGVSYSIDPPLDNPETGLLLNMTTGVVSGTPTAVVDRTYTVTATGTGKHTGAVTTQPFSITISPMDISAYSFSYPIPTNSLGNITVSPVWESSTPSDIMVTYAVTSTPGLPTGLMLNSDGSITGSFANLPHASAYTVTATATTPAYMGSTTGVFVDTLLLDLAYTPSTQGTAIEDRGGLEAMTDTGTYHLTNHIDLGIASWAPLFNESTPFNGTLHGNGYAIYNLNIAGTDADHYQGLFAAIGSEAMVENLGIGVTRITGGGGIGALAGVGDGTLNNITSAAMSNTTTIVSNAGVSINSSTNSYVGGLVGHLAVGGTLTGNSIGITVSGTEGSIGGLVGWNLGTISGYATGNVIGTGSSSYNVGGIAGVNGGGTVSGYTSGNINGTGNVGGLVGGNAGTVSGYATGNVTGTDGSVGGLVGHNLSNGPVSGYATGNISGSTFVGGHTGFNAGIATGYATGELTITSTETSIAGLVGDNRSIVNGYWDQASTGHDAGVGKNYGTFTGAGISTTKNILYTAGATQPYTDGTGGPSIFIIDAFINYFDLTGTAGNATWPKLKSSFTVGEQTINFPFPQPTVSDTDGDGKIEVIWPW